MKTFPLTAQFIVICTLGLATTDASSARDAVSAKQPQPAGLSEADKQRLQSSLAASDAEIRGHATAVNYLKRSCVYMKLFQFEKASRDIDAALKLTPNGPAPMFYKAMYYRAVGDQDSSLDMLTKAKGAPFSQAEQDLMSKAIDSLPDVDKQSHAAKLAMPFVLKAFAAERVDEFEEALRDYAEGLKIDPTSPQLHVSLIESLSQAGDFKRALKECESLKSVAPCQYHTERKQIFRHTNPELVEHELDEILKCPHPDPNAYREKAMHLIEEYKPKEAIEFLQRAESRGADVSIMKASLLLRFGKCDEALKTVNQYLKTVNPTDVRLIKGVLQLRVAIYRHMHRDDLADAEEKRMASEEVEIFNFAPFRSTKANQKPSPVK